MSNDRRCPTPGCVEYQALYDRSTLYAVQGHPMMPEATLQCEHCGGLSADGETWKHVCRECKKEVEPGGLTGLFVPHSCPACEQALAERQKASGAICRMCNQPFSRCCC